MGDDPHSIEPTIKDIEAFLQLPLENAVPKPDACRHLAVMLDTEAHLVVCKTCGKHLDPFWYLTLLAREWKQRAYQDAAAKDAYTRLARRDEQDRAKGRIFLRPTKPGPAQDAWDAYREYYGKDPHAIYYSAKDWWADDGSGGYQSSSFTRKLIADRIRRHDPESPPG